MCALGLLGFGSALPLRTIVDAPIAGSTNRFDYASLDARRQMLFVADLAGSRIIVFDTARNRVRAIIANIPNPHGVLAVPQLGRVYVSATGADQVAVIDEKSLRVIARVSGGRYPDGIAWASRHHKIYVSDEHGGTDTVIDTQTNARLGEIALGGDVGNSQYDLQTDRIYVAQQSANELIAIDPATDTIIARTPLRDCRGAHGVQLDAARDRTYVACEDNAALVTLDLRSMHQLATDRLGDGPDVLALDPILARLYVASESGVVSIFDVRKGESNKIAEANLADNAHIVAVDPARHRVYFPLRNVDGGPVIRVMQPR